MEKDDPPEWAREFAEHADVWGVGALLIEHEPDGTERTRITYLFDPRDEFNMVKLITRYVRCSYRVQVVPDQGAEGEQVAVQVSVPNAKFELVEDATMAAYMLLTEGSRSLREEATAMAFSSSGPEVWRGWCRAELKMLGLEAGRLDAVNWDRLREMLK